jgi:1-phosphatidylinositol-3-phosphate 5-kinase
VCNLCLRIMEEYKDDDDDDRRSIASVSTSARHPSISDRAFLSAALSPEMPYAKSPFAASQLFASHPDDTLGAIDEGSVPTRWGVTTAEDVELPYTPLEGSQGSDEDDEAIWTLRPKTAAPFRRPMDDEQSAEVHDTSQPASAPDSPALPSPNPGDREPPREEKRVELAPKPETRRVEFPRTDTMSTDGGETRVPLGGMDSNQPLIGLRTRLSSRASHGGLTALLDTEKAEGLWRARSHSFA